MRFMRASKPGSDGQLAHCFADRDHLSCERVAERRQGIELVHGLLVGGQEALLSRPDEDAAGFQCRWHDFLQANRARLECCLKSFMPIVTPSAMSAATYDHMFHRQTKFHTQVIRMARPPTAPWQNGVWRSYYAAA